MIELIVYSLATWRIASLLVNEQGPGNVFRRLRSAVGIEHDQDGNVTIIPDGFLAGIFSCVWCASVWVGFGWAGLVYAMPDVGFRLASAFAFSALAILIQRWLESRKN